MPIRLTHAIPILRIFDVEKADAFYLGFLGFRIDWDHRFHDGAPLYRQISRDAVLLNLSEHHGDSTPGTHIRILMEGVEAYHRELNEKAYRHMRPGLEAPPWGTREMNVIDPFGNHIRFFEPIAG